ncbi:hypothetical protein [Streptomyces lomondensis]|uniref:Uncharacterized protein n=1 Tax=Streptomyces lomondensis TaxID=68229 RepID=A0ABQ2WVS8_9ACTN|nr:hypothetical protein [Streptomyces lomondensis]MCF0078533.1 hypothetical protein [Streptomyces lomondensis]GGW78168.1 hypothetical protein GCM10010383_01910 [Streptomyces lomondensis]
MGSLRVTLCTIVLAAAALTPAAYAADSGGVSVIPATPAPGGDLTLRVTGCAQRTAVASSAAFVADARLTVTGGERELAGETRVRSTLRAGTYAVKVTCGDAERTGTLTVRDGDQKRAMPGAGAGGESSADGSGGRPPAPGSVAPFGGAAAARDGGLGAEEQPEASRRPGPHASPVAPVQAGGGGAADLVAAEDRGTGPGTAQGVTGLVLAGVAAVVVALGGVRRSRGTD